MRKRTIIFLFVISFILELVIIYILFSKSINNKQDTVRINECVKIVEQNYGNTDKYSKELDYSIIDSSNTLIYTTDDSNSKTLNEAILNNDVILDIVVDGSVVGKILIKNNTQAFFNNYRNYLFCVIVIITAIQIVLFVEYFLYLNKVLVKPFKDLSAFASRVAEGNLDIPLYMDKNHTFGEFTEAFDLMRTELKRARINEKKANDAKKEMVAKLSHDIKTPIASIKSTSEIGYEISSTDKEKNYFNLINVKADQVKVLVDNLFNSSISEITEINVNPSNYN